MPLKVQDAGPTFESGRKRLLLVLAGVMVVVLALGAKSGAVQRAWQILVGERVPVDAPEPVAASRPQLSEQEREWIRQQEPQAQAMALMKAAINHEEGATELIAQSLDQWQGKLQNSSEWTNLMMLALYSNDLRVRAAAIEINLSANNIYKTSDGAESIIDNAQTNTQTRAWAAWMLGMLANRGVEPERIRLLLETWMHDSDEETRLWAVEALANIGADETTADFLDVLRNDDSMKVRERAGCSLAKSGMMTRVQRMRAVPGLIQIAEESSVNETTKSWVFQALREITDEALPDEPGAWKSWYLEHGPERIQRFAGAGSAVLGNS